MPTSSPSPLSPSSRAAVWSWRVARSLPAVVGSRATCLRYEMTFDSILLAGTGALEFHEHTPSAFFGFLQFVPAAGCLSLSPFPNLQMGLCCYSTRYRHCGGCAVL